MGDNDELLAGIQNLNLEGDSDEEENPVMAAEREARKSLSSLPKWDGRSVPWRNFEDAVSNWRALNGIQAMPAEWQKRSLYFSLTSSAADRARPWRPGSALFNQAATFDDYITMLRGVFQPAEESEMSRVEFRARTVSSHSMCRALAVPMQTVVCIYADCILYAVYYLHRYRIQSAADCILYLCR